MKLKSTYKYSSKILIVLGAVSCFMALPRLSASAALRDVGSQSQLSISKLYQLGPGDRLRITVNEAPELSGDFEVLSDGTISLASAGTLEVSGLTLDEATSALTRQYLKLLRHPIVTLSLTARRPVRVAIVGEVTRPGVYTLGSVSTGTTGSNNTGSGATTGTVLSSPEQPTLTKLIQQAGGITQTADIRNIALESRVGRDGKIITQQINLWQLLDDTDLSQDPILRDGDRIRIPTATALKPEEIYSLSQASFAPATITVNVVGEVTKPGGVIVPPNTPLNQAILAAGGFNTRAERSNVELVRVEPNGTVTRRQLAVDFKTGPNEQRNPPLRPNDTVVVYRNGLTAVGDNLRNFIGTVTPLSPLLRLFGGNLSNFGGY
jgi:polysaccharide export outer membrane protein